MRIITPKEKGVTAAGVAQLGSGDGKRGTEARVCNNSSERKKRGGRMRAIRSY